MTKAERRETMNRRQFLAGISASAWLAATHASGSRGAVRGRSDTSAAKNGSGRIQSLRLETAAPLSEMKAYYRDLLELEILGEDASELTVRAGETRITFVAAAPSEVGAPFYHFAFNIPENKLLAARSWQRERTPLIAPYANLRDPQYPDDVVHFANWNAHSVFFWDPAGNLLEHIARHDLRSSADGSFRSSDILYASEIGLIADDVPAMARDVAGTFGLLPYRGASEQFTAVGDELGLLLVMKRGRNLGFDEGRPAGVFATAVTLRGVEPARYAAPDLPFRISSD